MEEQVVSIFAATPPEDRDSWIRRYEIIDVQRYEQEMLDYLRENHAGIFAAIRQSGKLDDEIEAKLVAALDEFGEIFQPSASSSSANEEAAA
jgi:F-type H+-transporting ATPase subunit alpha